MASLINKKAVKDYALATATEQGKVLYGGIPKFKRVSKIFYEDVERTLKEEICRKVKSTTKGCTL